MSESQPSFHLFDDFQNRFSGFGFIRAVALQLAETRQQFGLFFLLPAAVREAVRSR